MPETSAPPPPIAHRARFLDIDRTKGFAIALVVWGHLASVAPTSAPLWFYISISVIYSFHMPLFMYLSGFVFFLVDAPARFWNAPSRQALTRFDRLMVPFLFFGFVVVAGKYFAGSMISTVDPVDSLGDGIFRVLSNAPGNPSASIWYLLVLFVYTIIAPILWRLGRNGLSVIFVAATLGWAFDITELFYLQRISIYFLFFAIGGFSSIYRDIILEIVGKYYLYFMIVFGIICFNFFDHELSLLLCGIASIPALHGLFLQKFWKDDRVWLTLGRYSMAIYLLNTIVLGLSKFVLTSTMPALGQEFVMLAVPLFLAAMIGPMIFRRIMNAIPLLKPVARYLD